MDRLRSEEIADFCRTYLVHVEGPLEGHPLELDEWQKERIIRPLFDTRRPDGRRRYKQALVFLPRKNGKSTLICAVALFMGFADKEPGAKIVIAARDKDQANELLEIAKKMIRKNSELQKRATITKDKIITHRRAEISIIAADDLGNLGPNYSTIIIDELLAQKNRKLIEALIPSQIARSEPLFIMISTAGKDSKSILYEKYQYAKKVLAGVINDPTFLAIIFEAPKDADWKNLETWKTANPVLTGRAGKFIQENLEDLCRAAQHSPSDESAFRQFNLNQWVFSATDKFITPDRWAQLRGSVSEDLLRHLPAFGGMDLAETQDFCSFALAWLLDDGKIALRVWTWCSRRMLEIRREKDLAPLEPWVLDGYIKVAGEEVIERAVVLKEIGDICKKYHVTKIGYDPQAATYEGQSLEAEGYEMVRFRQTFWGMNAPTKRLLSDATELNVIDIDSNPVLAFAIDNVEIQRNGFDEIRPSKKKSFDKIDPAVAVIMAVGVAREGEARGETGVCHYENHDLRVI